MKSVRVLVPTVLVTALAVTGWATGGLGALSARLKGWVLACLEFIEGLDPVTSSLLFVALYVAATVLFVPGLVITMAAGLLFGVIKGTALVSLASVTGASLAFLIGRYAARGWVAARTADSPRFHAIDEAIGKEGARIVFLLRLSPLFPYNLLNYALGLTRISFGRYVAASWIGMLPGTLMYVYLGSLAGNLATLATGDHERTTGQWVFYGLGLVATVFVTIYVTRVARRALHARVDREDHPDPEPHPAS